MLLLYILIFIISCVFLYLAGEWVINGLMNIAHFLKLKEFVVGFFIMAFSASLPNFFVGIFSALHKIPELSFGDIVGGNVINLTLAISLAVLLAQGKEVLAESRVVQGTSVFVLISAILPIILLLDNELSRSDGIVLIIFFILYNIWLFSKKERFSKVYDGKDLPILKELNIFLKSIGKVILGFFLILIAAEGIVKSAQFFAQFFNFPLVLIGVLIVGLGNAIPETYLAIVSARRGQGWLILGNLMGSIIVLATLVLAIVALISPIKILDPSPFLIARLFLIISAIFFFFFVRTDRKITKREAIFLLFIYIIFVIMEIIFK